MFCLYVCMCNVCVMCLTARQVKEGVGGDHGAGVMDHRVGAGVQMQALCKSSKCS